MVGFQNDVSVGLKEFLYLVQVDDIGVVDSEKAIVWQEGIYFLQFFGKQYFLAIAQEDGAIISVRFRI